MGGAPANDTLAGGAGADTLVGGAGTADLADYTNSVLGVTVDLQLATAQTGGDAQGDVLSGVEYVIGSKTGANVLTGNSVANAITGGDQNDTLTAVSPANLLVNGSFEQPQDMASPAPSP